MSNFKHYEGERLNPAQQTGLRAAVCGVNVDAGAKVPPRFLLRDAGPDELSR